MNENATTDTPTFRPERLNLWDRFFNRYRREFVGVETEPDWFRLPYGQTSGKTEQFARYVAVYYLINRLTGSAVLERKYLN